MQKLCIKTLEPLILDYRPGVSNEHETLDYIPASRLRGAIFEALPRIDKTIDPEQLLGFEGPRWTDAWPANSNYEPFRRLPRCPDTENHRHTGWGKKVSTKLIEHRVKTEINMGVSRGYNTHSHRPGALYARRAVSPDQFFVAYVESTLLPENGAVDLNLGSRRSANGRCSLSVQKALDWRKITDSQVSDFGAANRIAIQCLSDIIVPGTSGGYLRGLDETAFQRLAECKVTVLSSHSSARIVSGWSRTWNLPQSSAIAIEAGSAWLLELSNIDRQTPGNFAKRMISDGLGIRTYEGFGTVIVNPDWLTFDATKKSLVCSFKRNTLHQRVRDFLPWPELKDVPSATLTQLWAAAETTAAHLRDKKPDVRSWISALVRNPALNVSSIESLKLGELEKKLFKESDRNAQLFFLAALDLHLDPQLKRGAPQ